VRCAREELPPLGSGWADRWPTVVGIGPAKSGSSSLNGYMSSLPECSNQATKGEPNFFNTNSKVAKGLSWYHYGGESLMNMTLLYEKSPSYSSSTLAPYTIRMFLGERAKLIFTTRDILELHSSLYLYLEVDKAKVSYADYVHHRIAVYEAVTLCHERNLPGLLIPEGDGRPLNLSLRDIHDPTIFDWQSANTLDLALAAACPAHKMPVPKLPQGATDRPFGFGLPVQALRHWAFVFPRSDQLLCLDLHMREERPNYELSRLHDFLNIPAPTEQQQKKFGGPGRHAGQTAFDRVVQSQVPIYGNGSRDIQEEVSQVNAEIIRVSMIDVTCADARWVEALCGSFPRGYESTCE